MSSPIDDPNDQPVKYTSLSFFKTLPLHTLFFAIIGFIYCLNLLPRTFWAENEAYYALGASNVLDGHVLLPVIYDTTFADKPPFMFWFIALLSFPLGGVTELSARVANLIPAFVILLMVYRFASHISLRAAVLATVVLATAHEFYEVAFEVNTDVLLTAFLVISWISLFRLLDSGFSWKGWALLWVPMSLAMLTKGPVAPVLSGLIAVAFAFSQYGWRDGWRRLISLRPFTGALICLLPFVLWCAAVYSQHGREPLDTILLRHNVQRFIAAFDHEKPWFYYFYTLPIVMLPWTVFLPLVAVQVWRAKKQKAPLPPWKSFALIVVLVGFVLFSWSSSKRAYYLLPLMPWLAVLIGEALSRIGEGRSSAQEQRMKSLVTGSAAAMLAFLLIYVAVGYRLLDHRRSIGELTHAVNSTADPNGKLVLIGAEDPRVIFYMPETMSFYGDNPEHNKQLRILLSEQGNIDILSLKGSLKRLYQLSPVPLYIQASANYRNGRYFVLTTRPGNAGSALSPETIKNLGRNRNRKVKANLFVK